MSEAYLLHKAVLSKQASEPPDPTLCISRTGCTETLSYQSLAPLVPLRPFLHTKHGSRCRLPSRYTWSDRVGTSRYSTKVQAREDRIQEIPDGRRPQEDKTDDTDLLVLLLLLLLLMSSMLLSLVLFPPR